MPNCVKKQRTISILKVKIFFMLKMSSKFYTVCAAIIFLFAGSLHAVRAYYEWDLIVGTWVVPLWVSWLVALLLLTMAVTSLKAYKR